MTLNDFIGKLCYKYLKKTDPEWIKEQEDKAGISEEKL